MLSNFSGEALPTGPTGFSHAFTCAVSSLTREWRGWRTCNSLQSSNYQKSHQTFEIWKIIRIYGWTKLTSLTSCKQRAKRLKTYLFIQDWYYPSTSLSFFSHRPPPPHLQLVQIRPAAPGSVSRAWILQKTCLRMFKDRPRFLSGWPFPLATDQADSSLSVRHLRVACRLAAFDRISNQISTSLQQLEGLHKSNLRTSDSQTSNPSFSLS